ncbi:MAG: hypothetical protein KatS3mg024_0282 [Armatimonadota bacterium]|nr:MAG: hypothetical protein KatS3mg024_0282 [Armatimonadota bacterium]
MLQRAACQTSPQAIERDILQVAVSGILGYFQKKIWGNKFELGSLSTIALVLDNRDPSQGATTEQMVEWMLRGEGEAEFTLHNGFDRDGIGGESSPGYSVIWNARMVAAGVEPERGDTVLRTYRGHGMALALGMSLHSLLAELLYNLRAKSRTASTSFPLEKRGSREGKGATIVASQKMLGPATEAA